MFFFFFFSSRRRHTRLQGDWSSDVCSSDLNLLLGRDDDVHLQAGGELDLVERQNVERIDHGDRERAAYLEQRDQLELAGNALRNGPHDVGFEDVRGEIHAWD